MGDSRLNEIQRRLEEFCDHRDWTQFHSLSNLAAAISVEAGELQELFLWSPPVAEREIIERRRGAIEAELADVMIQCLNLASAADIDVLTAIERKIEENEEKYPVSRSRGSADKYTEL